MAQILAYSGTLPLILCLLASHLHIAGLDTHWIAGAYSAVIISFVSGIHWGVYLFFAEKCPRNLLLTSNMIALLAWYSLMLQGHVIPFLLQASCFLYLLTLDLKLYTDEVLPEWFYALRRNATVIVILTLSALMVV
jgi:hypothetical protein